ncbi:MAG: 6-bladed beta-propeller, partial [Candidatus Aminicenantes bacterium]|nr:6-bladed beta-propeller [Candidatus Aminicenantes bacterium]NIM84121.1 6-bladed beta-propeller [Candidatus Aminicenantes bacterium]NIN23569.1 6-bladed beta-propeller [Candidatus Aminicenantes bacterium]NIN47276.1 6-bladed beta-propeller [Candidatus Aminicenantes bacterium]NIN90205.1 6-bladed beta-propeller [Candidatus Aminicenantes bacterium]
MKRIFCLLIGFGLMVTLIGGEEMMNKNAGRIIGLKELMRITDEEGDFYFKRPDNIQIAPDGSIFLTDEDQFLRFDKTGRFLNNLQKKGEGPGEYSYIFNYGFSDGKIIVYTGQPSKIIETDMTGKLLKENRIEQYMSFTRVIGFYDKKYWFVGSTFMDTGKKNSGLITVNLELCWGKPAGKIKKVDILFPEKWYLIKKSVGKGTQVQMTILVPAIFAMDQSGNLYASNTQKYNIQRVNLKKGEIIGKFGRKYSPVRYRVEESAKKKIKPLV